MHAPRFAVAAAQSGFPYQAAPAAVVVAPAASWSFPAAEHAWMLEVYRRAYEQARKAVAPTWYDRAAVPSPN
jgi:hypothetical protein